MFVTAKKVRLIFTIFFLSIFFVLCCPRDFKLEQAQHVQAMKAQTNSTGPDVSSFWCSLFSYDGWRQTPKKHRCLALENLRLTELLIQSHRVGFSRGIFKEATLERGGSHGYGLAFRSSIWVCYTSCNRNGRAKQPLNVSVQKKICIYQRGGALWSKDAFFFSNLRLSRISCNK